MHDDNPPDTWRQLAPFPDYSTHEPAILELEDTVQLCVDCGDVIPSGHESCRCANCREDYEQEKAQAVALLEQHEDES
jgi:hypothetical protein